MHNPYSEHFGRLPDFEVEYEFSVDPELKDVVPCQGMRTDFLYDGDDPQIEGINMIWPELLDGNGDVILDKRILPASKGTATMWIGMHESRVSIHRNRIQLGTKGYWVFGSKVYAKVIVTKIIGLFENEE
ncbi:hypothetical protein A9Q81_07710 [Gammaproteobacteria bacterium 42_54_T18]|nr:hypothetical protein A9Q81_07710 [Gammaproteobacteria bacterium 42_54_T18]